MRKHLIAASAILAATVTLVAAACGGNPTTQTATGSAACINASASHKAHVVVEHLKGSSVDRCVGFSGDSVAGLELLKQSGIEYSSQKTSFGTAICQVDNEPASFSSCFPSGAPFWALWVSTDGTTWKISDVGIDGVTVTNGEALGWRYTAPDASPAPPPAPKKG